MSSRPLAYVRNNAVAFIALFVALGGTSFAVSSASRDAEVSASRGVLYACVTKAHRTLNLSTARAKCPAGQRKISWNVVGPAGKDGARGPQGSPGAQGSAGAQGPAGTPGAAGVAGAPGQTGPTGPTGATGQTGTTGATGPVG